MTKFYTYNENMAAHQIMPEFVSPLNSTKQKKLLRQALLYLTVRQREVINLVLDGYCILEMAETLNVSAPRVHQIIYGEQETDGAINKLCKIVEEIMFLQKINKSNMDSKSICKKYKISRTKLDNIRKKYKKETTSG